MNSSFLIKITIIFLFSFQLIQAQIKKDSILATKYFQTAESLSNEKKLDSANIFFLKAAIIFEKDLDWENAAFCYNKISRNYSNNSQFDNAFYNAKKALNISKKYLNDNHEQLALSKFNIGYYYEDISNYEKALQWYNESLEIRQKSDTTKNKKERGFIYNSLGSLYFKSSKYRAAEINFIKAIALYKQTSDSKKNIINNYINLASVYGKMGMLNKASEYEQKFIEESIKELGANHLNIAIGYLNSGNTYFQLGDYNSSCSNFKKALKIFEEKLFDRGIHLVLGNMASTFHKLGEYEKAISYYKRKLNIINPTLDKHSTDIASTYQGIGINQIELGNYKEANQNFRKALHMLKKILATENHDEIAKINKSISYLYSNQGDHKESLKFQKKTLDIYKNIYPEENLTIADTYRNMGSISLELYEYEKAEFYFDKNLSIIENLLGKDHPYTSKTYNSLGLLYEKLNNYQKSHFYYKKAIFNNLIDKKKQFFDSKNIFDLKILLKTYHQNAQAYKLEFDKTKTKKLFDQSVFYYKKTDTLLNYLQSSLSEFKDQIHYSQLKKSIYYEIISSYMSHMYNQNKNESLYEAFYYSEKSKSNTLRNFLKDEKVKNFVGLPEDILKLENSINTDLAFYNSKITNESSEKDLSIEKINSYQNELFNAKRKQDSLTDFLEQNHPNYYRLKYKNTFLTVPEIQERLSNNTTILEFFTTDSVTYAFTLNKNDINVSKIATPNITQKIQQFRKHITSKNIIDYKNNAESLYATLIKPIVHQLKGDELIIVPDGPLWHLNFDLLLTEESTSKDPKQLPYMLRDYAISYANSVNVLFSKNHSNNNSKLLQECLAFSFSDSTQITDSESLSFNMLRNADADLPGTREEISAISEIVNGQYYYGTQAIEKNFKKTAHQYNILHLALHGEVDNEHPENSKLYFTKSNNSIEDDLLYSHELFALDIPAELVVLSACNTGTGKIAEGEGIMSLGNAFQYAGSKSLLLTNWEVPDQNTPKIMRNFYTHLSSKMSKSKALQQAKLNYLKNADITRSHPFYWGSFYILGDNKAIDLQTPSDISKTITWFVLLILVLCLTYFILKRRKKLSKK